MRRTFLRRHDIMNLMLVCFSYLEAQLMESAMMKTEQSTERPLSSALSKTIQNNTAHIYSNSFKFLTDMEKYLYE